MNDHNKPNTPDYYATLSNDSFLSFYTKEFSESVKEAATKIDLTFRSTLVYNRIPIAENTT